MPRCMCAIHEAERNGTQRDFWRGVLERMAVREGLTRVMTPEYIEARLDEMGEQNVRPPWYVRMWI